MVKDNPPSYGTTLARPGELEARSSTVPQHQEEESNGFLSGTVATVVLVLGTSSYASLYDPEEQIGLIRREPRNLSGFYFGVIAGLTLLLLFFFLIALSSL